MTTTVNLVLTIEDNGRVTARVVQPPRGLLPATQMERLTRRILRNVSERGRPVSKSEIYRTLGPAERTDERFGAAWDHLIETGRMRIEGYNRQRFPLWVVSELTLTQP